MFAYLLIGTVNMQIVHRTMGMTQILSCFIPDSLWEGISTMTNKNITKLLSRETIKEHSFHRSSTATELKKIFVMQLQMRLTPQSQIIQHLKYVWFVPTFSFFKECT